MSEYKRSHARIRKSLPVELIAPGEKSLFVTTYDISPQGIQLQCDGATVREIFGDKLGALPIKRPNVDLKLTLGRSGQDREPVDIKCLAMFSRRVSEQEYRIGLQIESMPKASRAALTQLLDE